ncbi:hypothetical protein M8C21_018559 [Ambrosia artemisiifolia]|uniref:Uncharacterized protein n=1 Tax=Ambrosia artemisiifolia TaxID=4212 RepID=A0AAD5BQZ3_AMBAR|nr:hypothetical protein M8C21_018559 [Ambrosia artemisiifolia]
MIVAEIYVPIMYAAVFCCICGYWAMMIARAMQMSTVMELWQRNRSTYHCASEPLCIISSLFSKNDLGCGLLVVMCHCNAEPRRTSFYTVLRTRGSLVIFVS